MKIASGTLNFEVYFWIAYVHYHEKRLPEALDAAKEAWKLSKQQPGGPGPRRPSPRYDSVQCE